MSQKDPVGVHPVGVYPLGVHPVGVQPRITEAPNKSSWG